MSTTHKIRPLHVMQESREFRRSFRYVWCISSLRNCRKWSDLWKLAKWHFAVWYAQHGTRCWPQMAGWAWADWKDQDLPSATPTTCIEEGKRGSCMCGKYNNQLPEDRQ